ncbi:unnamed protein product [Dibothriocephalus latus]|uniref:Uncharacterized protein n=1 Tax=Dibothriocephalus latus TaxID=60516 RepID=A0A3P7LMA8_DIBLA|nr:unnamed protein product [Dibothriocephalus latus]
MTLSNPFSRPLVYKCCILGASLDQFAIAEGSTSSKMTAHGKTGNTSQSKVSTKRASSPRRVEVVIPANSSREITLEFRPRAIRITQAVLLVVGQRKGPKAGPTMVFQLSGRPSAVTTTDCIQFAADCYEANERNCPIRNPLNSGGQFSVKLVEGEEDLSEAIMRLRGLGSQPPNDTDLEPPRSASKGRLRAFTCLTPEIHLPDSVSMPEAAAPPKSAEGVQILFLPFAVKEYQACLLFSNLEAGDFVVRLTGQAKPPKPMILPLRSESEGAETGKEAPESSMRIAPNLAAGEFKNNFTTIVVID